MISAEASLLIATVYDNVAVKGPATSVKSQEHGVFNIPIPQGKLSDCQRVEVGSVLPENPEVSVKE